MESISLPSRLHQFGENGSGSRAGFLNNIEAALNGNGNQKISSVQMSIADPATLQRREEKEISNLGAECGKSDDRMRMQGRSNKESDHQATTSHAAKLEIDFLPRWSDELLRRHGSLQQHHYDHEKSREHIFGQVETLRGLGDRQKALFDNRTNRMPRGLAALPILEKYVVFLNVFPYLPHLPVTSSIVSSFLVCIWPGVYVSSGMAYACTPIHPRYPVRVPRPGRGNSLETEWMGKNAQISALPFSCHANAMHAYVSALPHTLIFFAASITCAAYSPHLRHTQPIHSHHITKRYPTPLLFPLLSSFPSEIFLPPSDSHHNIAIHTALSTTSIISTQIKGLGKGLACGMMMLEEEKESVTNGLAGIAEAYEEGWHSGDEDYDSEG